MSSFSTNIDHQAPGEISVATIFRSLVLGFLGISLCISAFGLWLVPGGQGLPEVSLIKMGLSAALLIAGLCCMVMIRRR
ncbi:hypothetical protein [Tropicibacter oceani]|uniref:Uncharacterized protein n=1 Tax=Tropicibacter oceani TaxID=3058420 RepID=A0ABY8QCX0_9RHOB|nr:hypothetical protein [Tropicibacter oceani]WGW02471.1 hypothetical protein QF118_10985 [Tropicibacter oceani]